MNHLKGTLCVLPWSKSLFYHSSVFQHDKWLIHHIGIPYDLFLGHYGNHKVYWKDLHVPSSTKILKRVEWSIQSMSNSVPYGTGSELHAQWQYQGDCNVGNIPYNKAMRTPIWTACSVIIYYYNEIVYGVSIQFTPPFTPRWLVGLYNLVSTRISKLLIDHLIWWWMMTNDRQFFMPQIIWWWMVDFFSIPRYLVENSLTY